MAEKLETTGLPVETKVAAQSHVQRHGRHRQGAHHAHPEGEGQGHHTSHVKHQRGHHSNAFERA